MSERYTRTGGLGIGMAVLLAVALAALALTQGCKPPEYEVSAHKAELDIRWDAGFGYPDALAFSGVSVGTYAGVEITLTNVGNAAMTIYGLRLEEESTELFLQGMGSTLEPGEGIVATLDFAPMLPGEAANTFVVTHSADTGIDEVPIQLQGVGDPIPDIYATPEEHSFGLVPVGEEATKVFAIGNAGFGPLERGSVEITGDGADGYSVLADGASGQAIEGGGDPVAFEVAFAPQDLRTYRAELSIRSNDPDEDPLLVPLVGDGWQDGAEGLVAICAVDPEVVTPPVEDATWIGSGSYDANGYSITRYTWSLLERPEGSAAEMPYCPDTADCSGFVPDMAGTYTALLYVENALGHTSTCTTDLGVMPSDDLWVEIFWTHAGDDMDLHLIAPGGEAFSESDCHYGNCQAWWWDEQELIESGYEDYGLDWGVWGYIGDNPVLDLDDVPFTGPENINIADPPKGEYTVLVHDFKAIDSTFLPGNEVTVNVYIDGVKVYSDSRSISGENRGECFCTVDWPSGAITPCGGEPEGFQQATDDCTCTLDGGSPTTSVASALVLTSVLALSRRRCCNPSPRREPQR